MTMRRVLVALLLLLAGAVGGHAHAATCNGAAVPSWKTENRPSGALADQTTGYNTTVGQCETWSAASASWFTGAPRSYIQPGNLIQCAGDSGCAIGSVSGGNTGGSGTTTYEYVKADQSALTWVEFWSQGNVRWDPSQTGYTFGPGAFATVPGPTSPCEVLQPGRGYLASDTAVWLSGATAPLIVNASGGIIGCGPISGSPTPNDSVNSITLSSGSLGHGGNLNSFNKGSMTLGIVNSTVPGVLWRLPDITGSKAHILELSIGSNDLHLPILGSSGWGSVTTVAGANTFSIAGLPAYRYTLGAYIDGPCIPVGSYIDQEISFSASLSVLHFVTPGSIAGASCSGTNTGYQSYGEYVGNTEANFKTLLTALVNAGKIVFTEPTLPKPAAFYSAKGFSQAETRFVKQESSALSDFIVNYSKQLNGANPNNFTGVALTDPEYAIDDQTSGAGYSVSGIFAPDSTHPNATGSAIRGFNMWTAIKGITAAQVTAQRSALSNEFLDPIIGQRYGIAIGAGIKFNATETNSSTNLSAVVVEPFANGNTPTLTNNQVYIIKCPDVPWQVTGTYSSTSPHFTLTTAATATQTGAECWALSADFSFPYNASAPGTNSGTGNSGHVPTAGRSIMVTGNAGHTAVSSVFVNGGSLMLPPAATITPGTGCAAGTYPLGLTGGTGGAGYFAGTYTCNGTGVVAINITNPDQGWTGTPTLTFAYGGSTGAAAPLSIVQGTPNGNIWQVVVTTVGGAALDSETLNYPNGGDASLAVDNLVAGDQVFVMCDVAFRNANQAQLLVGLVDSDSSGFTELAAISALPADNAPELSQYATQGGWYRGFIASPPMTMNAGATGLQFELQLKWPAGSTAGSAQVQLSNCYPQLVKSAYP